MKSDLRSTGLLQLTMDGEEMTVRDDLPGLGLLPPLMTRMVTDQFRYADTGEPDDRRPSVAVGARGGAPTHWTFPRLRLPRLSGARTASGGPVSRDHA